MAYRRNSRLFRLTFKMCGIFLKILFHGYLQPHPLILLTTQFQSVCCCMVNNLTCSGIKQKPFYSTHSLAEQGFGECTAGIPCLFHSVWELSWECLKVGGWNRLEAHSITCLACNAGCQLEHLHVVSLYGLFWASLEHGGWVPRASVAGDRKWKLLVS